MYIYTFFFQITRHVIYSTLHILAFPFFKHFPWFNLCEDQSVYRHLTPPSLTQFTEGRATPTHTNTHTRVWPGWTNCMAATLLPQTHSCWLEVWNSVITSAHSFSDQDGGADMAATEKKCKGQTVVRVALPQSQSTDTKKRHFLLELKHQDRQKRFVNELRYCSCRLQS